MNITLERNTEANQLEIPYFAHIENVTSTVDTASDFKVPVYGSTTRYGQIYNLEICGFRIEAEDIKRIPLTAQRLLEGLINMARLPSYVFIARRAGGIYPVYTIDSEVWVTTPGGPVFRHVELAKVRQYLSDYLHDVHILGEKGLSDKLHVRGVDTKTLGLRRPVFYLKKRLPGQVDFWAPVFESGDSKRIYTYAANARREVPIGAGQEVIFLRELVAQALLSDNRLKDLHDLRPDRVLPAYWERLQASLKRENNIVVNGIEIPLYSNNYIWLGTEVRPGEDRYSLFVGKSAVDVRERVAQDFERRGMVSARQPEVIGQLHRGFI